MVDPRAILEFADAVAGRFNPERIILFGSYAYGSPTDDSDVDIMVVMRHPGVSALKQSVKIPSVVGARFPMDLIVTSPSRLQRRLKLNDFFLLDVVEKGVVLYEAADERVGREGRSRLFRRLSTVAVA